MDLIGLYAHTSQSSVPQHSATSLLHLHENFEIYCYCCQMDLEESADRKEKHNLTIAYNYLQDIRHGFFGTEGPFVQVHSKRDYRVSLLP
ncbi:hypothetical protein OPV22_000061 [Ensete ventricosum]|uniref:Uncharacterized protein n=1 Tax=Ensete ventricosum TaxID=4639 RepID=A0AAV8RSD2_ENSVE|nr:hypothetical protein OPV22_000061 [Ensete ventricosum]